MSVSTVEPIFNLIISSRQESSAIAFLTWIVIGMVVGYLGSQILNKRNPNLLSYLLLGILGAIVGGFLSNLMGRSQRGGLDIYSLVVAAVGAFVFLIVYQGVFRRRRFLNMD